MVVVTQGAVLVPYYCCGLCSSLQAIDLQAIDIGETTRCFATRHLVAFLRRKEPSSFQAVCLCPASFCFSCGVA